MFSDPSLNRFLQPDLIVSQPANPQTWNRYSYVSNRPILFNDPTGHYQTCGKDNDDPCKPHKKPSVSVKDPTPLSKYGKRGSGQQMKDTYDRLAEMCGQDVAWWCSSTKPLTLENFMIIVMSGEFSPLSNIDPMTHLPLADDPNIQNKLKTAAVNWFSDSCLAHRNCAGPTPNAIFNWLGENFESGQRLFPETAIPTQYPNVKNLATSVVKAVLTIGTSPKSTGSWNLVHWANASYFQDTYGTVPDDKYKVVFGENPFYVIPYGEENRMSGK